MLANHKGTVDLHGKELTHVWTELYETAAAGTTQIKVEGEVDWKVGDKIVLAPTAFNYLETEEAIIKSAPVYNSAGDYSTINLVEKLTFEHFSETETFTGSHHGTFEMPMKGEVGLLTRNIKFQGVIDSPDQDEYGAHIISHCDGHDCLTTRIEYIEMFYVGQAFLLGRYPIHFHRIGDCHNSYVKGNSIYHSFNRAVTVHGVNYLRIENNVAYNIQGHGFFIEDGVEENNVFDDNLIILVKRSWSLLMTDQMSGAFFITNPNNIFRRNRAVGAERMGFWLSFENHSTGPNFDESICPVGKKLGQFDDNHVHSNGMYGLRVFDQFIPREQECTGLVYDYDAEGDDYWGDNEPVCA